MTQIKRFVGSTNTAKNMLKNCQVFLQRLVLMYILHKNLKFDWNTLVEAKLDWKLQKKNWLILFCLGHDFFQSGTYWF